MIAAWTLGLLLLGQEEPATLVPEVDEETIDEVTVYGEASMSTLRARLRLIDEQFFDRYNVLNTNDEFDIVCKRETRLGSQIVRRVCLSLAERRATAEASTEVAEDFADGTNNAAMLDSPAWRKRHYRELRENIVRVMQADEDLRRIAADRKRLLEEIERRKQAAQDD